MGLSGHCIDIPMYMHMHYAEKVDEVNEDFLKSQTLAQHRHYNYSNFVFADITIMMVSHLMHVKTTATEGFAKKEVFIGTSISNVSLRPSLQM